jgi:hypothetical protein
MQIKLTPLEITEALIAHLRNKGLDVDTKPVSFVFYNRRTKGGVYAEATIGEDFPSEPLTKVVVFTDPKVEMPTATTHGTIAYAVPEVIKLVEGQEPVTTNVTSLFG